MVPLPENVFSCSAGTQNSHGCVSIPKSAAAGVGKTNAPGEQENPQKDRGVRVMHLRYAPTHANTRYCQLSII